MLLANANHPLQNGIYQLRDSGPVRVDDMALGAAVAGSYVFVNEGTDFHDTGFVCDNNQGNDIVGIHALRFVRFAVSPDILIGTGLVTTHSGRVNVDSQVVAFLPRDNRFTGDVNWFHGQVRPGPASEADQDLPSN